MRPHSVVVSPRLLDQDTGLLLRIENLSGQQLAPQLLVEQIGDIKYRPVEDGNRKIMMVLVF